MKAAVYFLDGEVMKAEVDSVQLKSAGLRVRPLDHANNDLTLVSLGAIKYIVVEVGEPEGPFEADPRDVGGARRLVLRYNDANKNVMYTYLDRDFAQDGEGVRCKVWNPQSQMMETLVVPMLALKAVFTVKDWDSRNPGPMREITSAERELWARW